jgi:hydrogenase nickel incorporation protein HypA/HybF
MHELGITRNIVAIASDAANGRRVLRVTLEVGRLSGVMTDAIAFCFPVVAEGTVLQGAELDILAIGGRARCSACGSEFEISSLYAPCPCGSRQVERLQGDELLIKSIELEEAA